MAYMNGDEVLFSARIGNTGSDIEVVQETGESSTAVMSQKAVTAALNAIEGFTYEDFTEEQLAALKGEKGDTGEKGEKGDTGEKGEKGDTGEKGEKGDTGEKGDAFTYEDFTEEQLAALKGEKGDTGEKGEKGDTGEKGEKGDTGEMPSFSANDYGKFVTVGADGSLVATSITVGGAY